MTCLRERKWVPHSADQMLDLVADVDKYPEFLPWCVGTRIRESYCEDNHDIMVADLRVAFKAFRESFTSRVNIDREARRIDIEYLEGPFKHLNNRWLFEENEDESCTVDFVIDFEFKSKALQLLIGAVCELAFRRMVTAFVERADAQYGAKG